MKKLITFVTLGAALILTGLTSAQTYHNDDKQGLRDFLLQPSGDPAKTNAEQLGLTVAEVQSSDENWISKLSTDRVLVWNDANPKRLIRIGDYQTCTYKRLGGTLNTNKWAELKSLHCIGNELKEIIVSGSTKLEVLDCTANYELLALNVSNNTALKVLCCGFGKISTLDVSKNTELKSLDCMHNKNISTLDVSNCPKLTSLSCAGNKIKSLNLSALTLLDTLECSGNQITALNLSANTALTKLFCKDNQLSSLNLTANTKLKILECERNNLTVLELDANTLLTKVACDNNKLTSLNLSALTQLNALYCHNNKLTELDLTNNHRLNDLGVTHNELYSVQLSPSVNLAHLYCDHNHFMLSDLFYLAQKSAERDMGGQTLSPRVVVTDEEIHYAPEQNVFAGVYTGFHNISKDGNPANLDVDYTVTNGMLTLKTAGTYTVIMKNEAITARPFSQAAVEAIYYAIAPNNDAFLDSLAVSTGTLTPPFNRNTILYTVNVPHSVTEITITLTTSNPYAMTVSNPNGVEVVDPNSMKVKRGTFDLEVGENEFVVTTTSTDGSNTSEYTVKVIRAAQGNSIAETTQSGITVYPNPVTSELHIRLDTQEITDYMLYNSTGQIIMSGKVQHEAAIHVESLPKGIYYLRVKEKSVKVVK